MKRRKTNRKMLSKRIMGLSSLILTATVLTGCTYIVGTKEYENYRIDFSNDGKYNIEKQYKPFDSGTKNNELVNTLTSYGGWELMEDGSYSRIMEEYNIKNETYDSVKEVFNNNTSLEEAFGKPTKVCTQISENVSKEEIERGAYIEATIYGINEDKYVMVKDHDKKGWILIFGGVAFVIATGALIGWQKYDEKKMDDERKKLTLKKREN